MGYTYINIVATMVITTKTQPIMVRLRAASIDDMANILLFTAG